MAQVRAAGSTRSYGRQEPLPPRVVAFDPVGEIAVGDNRAAALAALADSFAERFGVDETGPSAAARADRFGMRYEPGAPGPEQPPGGEPGRPGARRTVTITGRGSARGVPPAERSLNVRGSRGNIASRQSAGMAMRADHVALCAVALGLLLALVAAVSAHAATLAVLPVMR